MKVTSIYALILLILIYFHNDYAIDTFIGYVIGTVLLYKVAVGAAVQLLVYCRFKFKSFNITWNERECVGEFKAKYKIKTKSK